MNTNKIEPLIIIYSQNYDKKCRLNKNSIKSKDNINWLLWKKINTKVCWNCKNKKMTDYKKFKIILNYKYFFILIKNNFKNK